MEEQEVITEDEKELFAERAFDDSLDFEADLSDLPL